MAFPIIQFGTSRFLQAHVDLFVSEALAKGGDRSDASSRCRRRRTSKAANASRRSRQAEPYDVQIRGSPTASGRRAKSRSPASGGGVDAQRSNGPRSSACSTRRAAWSRTPRTAGYEIPLRCAGLARLPRSFPPNSRSCSSPATAPARRPITLFPCELTPANGRLFARRCSGCFDGWRRFRRAGAGSPTTASGSTRWSTASSRNL